MLQAAVKYDEVMPDPAAAILIVDDNDGKRLALEAAVSPLGYTVVAVDSGEAALRAVMRRTFAVILMDVQMPGMDGYETARMIRLRSESEHTPIIFITAHTKEEAKIPFGYANGAVDFMIAPIEPQILRAKVTIFIALFLQSRELLQSLEEVTALSNALHDSDVRTRSVLAHVADGIVTVCEDGKIESLNRAATKLFGYSEEEAIGLPIATMIAPDASGTAAEQEASTRRTLEIHRKSGLTAESLGHRKDGSTFAMEIDLSDVDLGDRKVHIACMRDVSDRQVYTEALRFKALHDNLTDLPNRVLFRDRVAHSLQVAVRSRQPLSLFVLDLNDFKQVNDTLSHDHGDQLLKHVASRLVDCLRDGDTVARLGGDEFGILALGTTDIASAAAIAWKIRRAIAEPFSINGHSVEIGVSIGIVVTPDHGNNIDDLLRRADLAMYDAKRSGSGFAVFVAEQEKAPARRLALLNDLRHCVERDELTLHFQPKIDLRTLKTIGVEALVRWNHPSGDLLMPGAFMPEVENSELMLPVTEWVTNHAMKTLKELRDAGFDLTMAINLGARCLSENDDFFSAADESLERWGIPPDRVIFELTESALIDIEAPDLTARLKKRGEQFSIDDFGTGYSSLAYLQRLPVGEIKADRSFVTDSVTVKDDEVIVRAIIDLAHNLDLRVVAEGVEDKATMDLLINNGCDIAQGYFFSRPVPFDALQEWLLESEYGQQRRGATPVAASVPVSPIPSNGNDRRAESRLPARR